MTNTNEVYNKEEFARLLDMAKGNRSVNQYARESGVSAAHISRLLRALLDNPPTPTTIDKFAQAAYNNISYCDLMIAAGHISLASQSQGYSYPNLNRDNYNMVAESVASYSPSQADNRLQEVEGQYLRIILDYLNNSDYSWTIQKTQSQTDRSDLVVDIDDPPYRKWIFEFQADTSGNITNKKDLAPIYGQLAMRQYQETDKVILVVNNSNFYQAILDNPPVAIRANNYVMMIDLSKGAIVKEEPLAAR